jgi:hypothetical protein
MNKMTHNIVDKQKRYLLHQMLMNQKQNLVFDLLVNLILILKNPTQFYFYLGETDSIDNDVTEENSEKKTK